MAIRPGELLQRWRSGLLILPVTQQQLLRVYLLMVLANSLVFYVLPLGSYNHDVNLWHAAAVLLLWGVLRRPAHFVHATTALSWVLLLYVTANTGGVNSTTPIWFSILAVAVLMLLGPRAMLVWMVLILLSIVGMREAIVLGWVDSLPYAGPEGVPWTLMNYMLVTVCLMFTVLLFDNLHQWQLAELHRRNDELRATHQALREAQAHKDEFVAAVGHELRTPMNAILGLNGVLHAELSDRPEQAEVVEHIRRSTRHLLQVVNDILDFSQLQAGKLVLHPVDFALAGLVEEALHRHRPRAQAKGLALQADIDPGLPPFAHGDRQRLLQVLSNLLDNAIKFTAEGRVDLRLRAQGAGLRVEVQDTGLGIPQERQAHIFNRFEHADVQTNRTYGGTGLGLTLCQQLTHLLGGQIGVHSQPGQGALFWLELPLHLAQSAQPDDVADLLVDEALRILVVDDNAVNLQVAQLQLQRIWPHAQITTAQSGAGALQWLDTQAFDVALVDMVMPEMDGITLTRQIRQRFPADTAHMPILALTANTHAPEHEQCLTAGMADVLHKPVENEVLQRVISRHIRKARG